MLALVLALHACTPAAKSAASSLPKPLVFKETVAITQIDFSALDAGSLMAAAKTLGIHELPEVKERIAELSAMREEMEEERVPPPVAGIVEPLLSSKATTRRRSSF